MDQRQCELFLAQVQSRRLPGDALASRVIEYVVADLECQADLFAVFAKEAMAFGVDRGAAPISQHVERSDAVLSPITLR